MKSETNTRTDAPTSAPAVRGRARALTPAMIAAHVSPARKDSAARAAARRCGRRLKRWRAAPDAGMSTAEYAVGTIAACGFAAVLYKIVTSGPVRSALTGVIEKALHVPF